MVQLCCTVYATQDLHIESIPVASSTSSVVEYLDLSIETCLDQSAGVG